MSKHNTATADLAAEFARILDLESVRPVYEGHVRITSVVGSTVLGQVVHAHDGSVVVDFAFDVNVP